MNDKQKGLFSEQGARRPHVPPERVSVAPEQQEKRPFIRINFDGKGLLIVGVIVWLLLESFAPKAFKPSIYLARRAGNFEAEQIKITQAQEAEREALKVKEAGAEQVKIEVQKTVEVGTVNLALKEKEAELVQKLTMQIQIVKECEANKIQLANQAMAQCIGNGESTATDCEVAQWMIEDQPCPDMPVMTEANQKLLESYRTKPENVL